MKAVTLRSLPPNVAEAIRKEANRKGVSLNKAVISLLENRVGAREKKIRQTPHHDLDDLAGSWSKQEAAEFDKSLADHRSRPLEIMRLLVDTSAYSVFMRGHGEIKAALQEADEIFVNSIVWGS